MSHNSRLYDWNLKDSWSRGLTLSVLEIWVENFWFHSTPQRLKLSYSIAPMFLINHALTMIRDFKCKLSQVVWLWRHYYRIIRQNGATARSSTSRWSGNNKLNWVFYSRVPKFQFFQSRIKNLVAFVKYWTFPKVTSLTLKSQPL